MNSECNFDSIKFKLNEIIKIIKLLTKSNTEIEKSVNCCSGEVDSFDATLNKLSNTIIEYENRFSDTESICYNLELEIDKLHSHINFLNKKV